MQASAQRYTSAGLIVAAVFFSAPGYADEALCTPDIDGNGEVNPLTDGQLVLRHLFGFSGPQLTDGAIGPGAVRTSAESIQAHLSQPDCLDMLDVDGNGQRDALSDGILFTRYIHGYRGEALVDGALGAEARSDADAIATHLAFYSGVRTQVLAEQVGAGASVDLPDALGEVRNSGQAPVAVDIKKGFDEQGGELLELNTSGPLELLLPDPNLAPAPRAALPRPRAAATDYPVTHVWKEGLAWFSGKGEVQTFNRIPGAATDEWSPGQKGVYINEDDEYKIKRKQAYELVGACASDAPTCYGGWEPVLLIHGFTLNGGLGGGEEYWSRLPGLIQGLSGNPGFVPFEFRWSTAARFQDVAADLAAAINTLGAATGRKVHIIAHSYGGLLTRTLLQLSGNEMALQRVGSVVTIGTPHSGILKSAACAHGIALPDGQDTDDNYNVFRHCGQLTCQMAGEDTFGSGAAEFFGVQDDPGELIATLADLETHPLPDLDILVLMGLTTRRDKNDTVDAGDALITYEGQRFLPGDSTQDMDPSDACQAVTNVWRILRQSTPEASARVTERLLEFPDTTQPNGPNPDPTSGGYRHSRSVDAGYIEPPAEAFVDCATDSECTHHTWLEIKEWLSPTVPVVGTHPLNDTGIDWCADGSRNFLDCPVDGYPWQDAQDGRDATHNDDSDGHAGFSFTKLDANGNPLPSTATHWSCVRDNVTGLVWEVKTDDGGLRDKDWTYSWYNPDSATNGGSVGYADYGNNCYDASRCDTHKFVADVNAQGLCGARDWRLPGVRELLSIVANDRVGPAIDTRYFPNTQPWGVVWSSSPHASNSSHAWIVGFDGGYVYGYGKSYGHYVRLVRGGQ